MGQRFLFLVRAGKKLAEVAVAGCASAIVAFLLGTSHEPASPTPAASATAPAVVRLAPADEEMIRAVRQESATLVAHLRTQPGATSIMTGAAAPATAATENGAAATSTPAKPAKTIPAQPAVQPRKDAKVSRPAAAETKPRTVEPTPTVAVAPPPPPPVRAQSTATMEMSEPRLAQALGGAAESGQPVGIKPISKWFSEVPRPPVGIGEDASRSM
jgi:hypothetical protein